ncbi:MAG: exodeoxyribonuclease VII small subunit [Candidatus Cloacimonetes bacterium]|nr:exodeoxyribonuclease VII small subunit [Candidatus Cloacimonadota bacterium]
MKFEESLRRLEVVVDQLEQGGEDLDEILRLFEEGTRLVDVCSARLTEVEARFEELQTQLERQPENDETQTETGDKVESPKE